MTRFFIHRNRSDRRTPRQLHYRDYSSVLTSCGDIGHVSGIFRAVTGFS
jgi:hypothetical protein